MVEPQEANPASETTPTETAAAPTPAATEVTETSPGSDPSNEGDPAAPAAVAPPAFVPNLKFKVRDKEHEIDSFMKDVIKDADTEKKVRDLYEKAYGVDLVFRPKIQEVSGQLQDVQTKYTSIGNQLRDIGSDITERGDLDSLVQAFNVPMETVKKWMLQKLQQEELPPEQRAVYDQERQYRMQAKQLEKQNQLYQQQLAERATSERVRDLNSVLASAEVKSVVDSFDSRLGRPGAFFDQVIKHAQWTYLTTGRDLPAEDAVREVLGIVGSPVQSAPASAAPNAQVTPSAPLPVIPTVAGRGSSPAKRVVKSIADLKKIGNEMAQAEG